jgi:hypothetical protein
VGAGLQVVEGAAVTAPARFRQADLTRALKAALAVAADVRVELEPDGKMVILTGQLAKGEKNPWDDE